MRLLLLGILLFNSIQLLAQNKAYDKLEMLYDQGHYKKVLRQTNRLLKKEEHQKAILPGYYKGLALLQLYTQEKYRSKNPEALSQGKKFLIEAIKKDKNKIVLLAHSFEIQALKKDYDSFLEELQGGKKQEKTIAEIRELYQLVFQGTPDVDEGTNVKPKPTLANISETRKKIIQEAYKLMGTPYMSGGTTPSGFDCSGFVNYVFQKCGVELPRISREQQRASRSLELHNAQPGDLVFFSNGSSVNHVGIVVENENGKITMIHSSSSKGIILTEINTSKYWSPRVHSYGTFL
jgi:cell wall-associated NlpC family hydrolase